MTFSDEEVISKLGKTSAAYMSIYSLLPETIRNSDSQGALRDMIAAAEAEYRRSKDSIQDVLLLVDPLKVNTSYIAEGSPVFHHPEQFLVGTSATTTTLVLNGSPSGLPVNNFYYKFGVYIFNSATAGAVGQYRLIESYDGSTKTAVLDRPLSVAPSGNYVVALCWPDRVWLPVEIVSDPRRGDGTLLPIQASANTITLPAHFYISNIDDYYNNWKIKLLSGEYEGTVYDIVDFVGESLELTLSKSTHVARQGDWFKLIPPGIEGVAALTDFFTDRWIRIPADNSDPTYPARYEIQTRKIIRSVYDPLTVPASNVLFVYDERTQTGKTFDYPPSPDARFGILTNYVSLDYVASNVGFTIDRGDFEDLQREQIRGSFEFTKLKGTKRAFELICRSFGLNPQVVEQASNYAPDAPVTDVGPHTINKPKYSYDWNTITPVEKRGRNTFDVPGSYLTNPGADAARIPDSDIKLFLSRRHPSVVFGGDILNRIAEKLEDVTPIHVQIVLVGFLQPVEERVSVESRMSMYGTYTVEEEPLVEEVFLGTPIGTYGVLIPGESVDVTPQFAISISARYDIIEGRADNTSRLDIGKIVSGDL